MAQNKAKAENKIRKIAHEMNYYLKHGYAISFCKKGCRIKKKETTKKKTKNKKK